jgi:transketolase
MNERSKQVRRNTIKLSKENGGYHWGGAFSAVEILIALFDNVLKPNDKFILSKGHACWPYYVLLREKGYNPKLDGHPSRDPANGIHCTTGSLGHGFPTAVGMAMAKKAKSENGKIYALLGDGECQEGTTWEAMLVAAKYKLDNLVVIIDWNKIQGSDFLDNILPIAKLEEIAEAIGWMTSTADGHCVLDLLAEIKQTVFDTPSMVIANTTKGKGISFMEGKPEWHARWLSDEEEKVAMEELE